MVRQRRSTTLSKEVKASFLFDGIHFRCIGRNVKKDHILRNVHHFRFMPGSTITAKQNDIVGELGGQFPQEQIHTYRITIGHDQEAGFTGQRLHGMA